MTRRGDKPGEFTRVHFDQLDSFGWLCAIRDGAIASLKQLFQGNIIGFRRSIFFLAVVGKMELFTDRVKKEGKKEEKGALVLPWK